MSIFDLLLVSFSCLGRGGGVRRSLRWICLFVLGDFVVGGGGGFVAIFDGIVCLCEVAGKLMVEE